jgi:SagB-type dehydrogenase family enzyme
MSVKEIELETKATHDLMKAFLHATSFVGPLNEYIKLTPEANGVPPPPLELPYDRDARTLDLPKPGEVRVRAVDLRYVIENRRSVRNYSGEGLSLEELSWLLWCTQGVKEIRKDRPATYRNVPSGGSRHPFETYLLLNRVRGVPPGIYRFLALEHKLLEVRIGEEICDEIAQTCGNQRFVANSAVVFIWSFIPSRTTWRYGPKAYKGYLEVGHICQNLYLSAEAVDCGVCAIGAYDMDEVHKALGIRSDDEFVVYIATVGKKKQATSE